MRQACFNYLAKGGSCASGPVSLLSGLNPSPSMLVMHFFSVALFGVGRLLRPRPTFRGLYMCIALLLVASRIILPIIWVEGVRAVFFPRLAPKPLSSIKRVQSLRSIGGAGALTSSAGIGLSQVRSALR
ncbi:squalene epoxidase-domain-containing protein [Scenedesmus sp. NREL 46B-D3]|nr:squalene epoxidase-domain-containing protein [Scenedesmus sp. NREL 46B-D3]